MRSVLALSALSALFAVASGCSKPPPPPQHLRLIEAAAGAADALVRDAMAAAAPGKRRVLVYAGATWCEPCQHFHHAAEAGALDDAFADVDLLAFDLDRDRDRLVAAGYRSKYIPLFALPGADGRASGKQIEGSIKGDGAVAEITPRLRELLGR